MTSRFYQHIKEQRQNLLHLLGGSGLKDHRKTEVEEEQELKIS